MQPQLVPIMGRKIDTNKILMKVHNFEILSSIQKIKKYRRLLCLRMITEQ